MAFKPTWTGDQKKRIDTTKSSNIPDKSMWGRHLADQDIDQRVVYKSGPKGNRILETKDAVGVITNIIGQGASEANKLDINGLRSGLPNQSNDSRKGPKNDISVNTATMLRRSGSKQKMGKRSLTKRKQVQLMYKSFGFGKEGGDADATGTSMALAVVKQTANKALATQSENLKPKIMQTNVLQHDSFDKDSGAPDLPIGLPRGRLAHTYVFLLGRKMRVNVLRIGKDKVRYEVQDDEMRTYVLETTEREVYDSMAKNTQTKVAHVSVDKQIPFVIARLGFKVHNDDRRKKELAILKYDEGQSINSDGTNAEAGVKKKWGKMRKLTSSIGVDMFSKKLQKNPNDASTLISFGMFQYRRGSGHEAVRLFARAIRVTGILQLNSETGRHSLNTHRMSALSKEKHSFNAKFWNVLATVSFEMYLDDLRLQVLNLALDASEIASRFLENVANQKLWILRGRIHESLGHLHTASDLYEYCINHFGAGKDLNEVIFRAAAIAKRLGRFTRAIAYMEYALINPSPGYTQTDVLFQVARVHEQEGKIDIASDGFRQAFKLTFSDHHALERRPPPPKNWRKWINIQETWDLEAERAFRRGYFAISIDMLHRSLMIGDKLIESEKLKPFGGEAEQIKISSSERWWKAAVSALHLGESHTALKACEEAVENDPSNSIARAALQKWKLFFLEGEKGDVEDPDLIVDMEEWEKFIAENDSSISTELRLAQEHQTRAAIAVETITSADPNANLVRSKELRKRRMSRRLSISGGNAIDSAALAAAESKKRQQAESQISGIRESKIVDEMRPGSSSSHRISKFQRISNLGRPRPATAGQGRKREKSVVNSGQNWMFRYARSALKRLFLMGTVDLNILFARSNAISAKYGLANKTHALVGSLLLDESFITEVDLRDKEFRDILETVCKGVDAATLISSRRPNLLKLRKLTDTSQHDSSPVSLDLLSPVGKSLNLSSSTKDGSPKNQNGRLVSPQRLLSIERFHNGRLAVHSHFDHIVGRNKCGSKRLESILDRAFNVHGNLGMKTHNARKVKNKQNLQPSRNQIKITRVSKFSRSSSLSARQQRDWPGNGPRKDHFRKQRSLTKVQLSNLEFEKTKASKVIVMRDGKLVASSDDAVLASKVFKAGLGR